MTDLTWTTRSTRLVGLRMTLEGFDPARPRSVLRDLAREADWRANRQVRKGKIGRVLPTGQIAQAGLDHLARVDGQSFQDATRYRDGLMVAMLALTALRITNFRDLEIGRSFLIHASGFDIALSADETKNHRALEREVPARLINPILRYLDIYRPVLLAKSATPHAFLWVNDWGNRYTYSNLSARFRRLTKQLLGIAIPPHYVRDSAATTIARLAPSKSRGIAGALGHATLKTSERYYNQARCLDASRSYTPFIEDLVDEAIEAHSRRTANTRTRS
ncbi:MAG: tyrosine-type recombinase/integrase [Pseudomonadota bacterium]